MLSEAGEAVIAKLGGAVTVMLSDALVVSDGHPESLTWTVKLEAPAVVAMPEFNPLSASRVKPLGKLPAITLQV